MFPASISAKMTKRSNKSSNNTATYPQFLSNQVAVEVVDNVWILVFPHDKDLIDDEFLLGLLRQVHGLDGHLSARGHFYSDVHCA